MKQPKHFALILGIALGLVGFALSLCAQSPASNAIKLEFPSLSNNQPQTNAGSAPESDRLRKDLLKYLGALATNPLDSWNTWQAARSYFMLRDYSAAASYFEKYARLEPTVGQARYWIAQCALEMGDAQTAKREALQCLKLDPNYTPAYHVVAEACESVIATNYNDDDAHFWLGWSLFCQENVDRALREMEIARQLPPHKLSKTYYLLGAYARSGHWAQAFVKRPVLWTLTVVSVLVSALGSFAWASAKCLNGIDTPGIGLALLWTFFFFASEVACLVACGILFDLPHEETELLAMILGPLPLIWIALARFSKLSWGSPYQARLQVSWRIWLLAGVFYLVVLVGFYGLQRIFHLPPQRNLRFISDAARSYPILGLFCAVFEAPLAEEILCRGLLYDAFQRRWGLWAIPLSSLVFAAYHFDPPHFVSLFAMGLLFGWLRQMSGGVWASFLVHAANNALAYAVVSIFAH